MIISLRECLNLNFIINARITKSIKNLPSRQLTVETLEKGVKYVQSY